MIALWCALGATLVLALGFVAVPLLRRTPAPRQGLLFIALALLLAVCGAGLYALWGKPAAAQRAAGDSHIDALRQYAEAHGEQPEVWLNLGDAYIGAQQWELAQQAFVRADNLAPGRNPRALLGMAAILLQSDDELARTRALALYNQVLSQQPDSQPALFYSALILSRQGALVEARARYTRMQQAAGVPEKIRAILAQQIAALDAALAGQSPAAAAARASSMPAAGPVDAATAIHVHVDVAPELRSRLPAGASLFVFARNPAGGPPLAVRRLPLKLPADVVLSAADAMLASNALTHGQRVNLVARVSTGGQPAAAAGDAFGQVQAVAGSRGRTALLINRITQ